MNFINIKCSEAVRQFLGKMRYKNGTGFEYTKGSKHERFKLVVNDVEYLIHTQFSRSPNSYIHPSVPDQLEVSEEQLRLIIRCKIDLLKYLRIIGLI